MTEVISKIPGINQNIVILETALKQSSEPEPLRSPGMLESLAEVRSNSDSKSCIINIDLLQKAETTDVPGPTTNEELVEPKKGRLVTFFGRERLQYWCPRVGGVAGSVLGFYATNYAVNLAIFFAVRQNAQVAALQQSSEKLAPYVGKCITCNAKVPLEATANNPMVAELNAKLVGIIAANKENFKVLETVATNIDKAAASAAKTTIVSTEGATAAANFAKAASYGDVPLRILSLSNAIGAASGAFAGYKLGEQLFSWLDSEIK